MTRRITFYYLLVINIHVAMLGACRSTSQSAADSILLLLWIFVSHTHKHPQSALKTAGHTSMTCKGKTVECFLFFVFNINKQSLAMVGKWLKKVRRVDYKSSVKICDSILMALCQFGKPVPQNPVPTLVAYIDLETWCVERATKNRKQEWRTASTVKQDPNTEDCHANIFPNTGHQNCITKYSSTKCRSVCYISFFTIKLLFKCWFVTWKGSLPPKIRMLFFVIVNSI